MTAAQLIRRARIHAGITQAELGRRLGVKQPAIARWERGAVEPGLSAVRRAVSACGAELKIEVCEVSAERMGQIRSQLALSPQQRVQQLVRTVRFIERARASTGKAA